MARHHHSRELLAALVAGCGLACASEPDDYGPPALLQLFKGPAGSQESGVPFDRPAIIQIADRDDNPLPLRRIPITATITSGDGTLDGTTKKMTAATGMAVFDDLAITGTPGEKILTFSAPGLISARTTINLSGIAHSHCRGKHTPNVLPDIVVRDMLESRDCTFHGGQLHDFYSFILTGQEAVVLSVQADGYDPAVDLFTFVDQRDRGTRTDTVNATRQARLKAILPSGMYEAAASAVEVGAVGPYTLELSATSESAESCETVFVVSGVTSRQQLGPSDCLDNLGAFYGDAFRLWLWAGEQVAISQSSTEFGPLLQLYRASGALVDQTGGGGSANLGFTADVADHYVIMATSDQMFGVGEYTLELSRRTDLVLFRGPLYAHSHPAGTLPLFDWKHAGELLHPRMRQP